MRMVARATRYANGRYLRRCRSILAAGRVRVPMKAVLIRVGKGSLHRAADPSGSLTPVRADRADVLQLLLGSGCLRARAGRLGRLPGDAQRQAVADAHRAAALDDSNVGGRCATCWNAPLDLPATSGTPSQIDDPTRWRL